MKSSNRFRLLLTALQFSLLVLLVSCTTPATAEPTEAPVATEVEATEVAPTEEPVAKCDEPVFFFAPAEFSGGGATPAANWKDGATIAIEEINESGGLLGCQIEVEWVDTQSDPAVSKAVIAEGLEKHP